MSESTLPRIKRSGGLGKIGAYIIFLCLVSVFAVLIWLAQDWTQKQKIYKIKFNGLTYLKSNVLFDSVKTNVLGKKKAELDLVFLENKIKTNPFVMEANANFAGLNGLDFEVKERRPIAFFQDTDGEIKYIDSLAVVFPNIAMTNFADMPVITGIDKKDKQKLNEAIKIINQMQSKKDKFVYNLTSELQYDTKSKSYYLITSDLGIKVNFGKVNDFEEKIFKIEKFWNKWLITKNKTEFKEIDVRWKNQVILI